MAGSDLVAAVNTAAPRVEAPITFKAYLMCAFAAFGGIFFGYDSGYINGVMGMPYFIDHFAGPVRSMPTSRFCFSCFEKCVGANDVPDV